MSIGKTVTKSFLFKPCNFCSLYVAQKLSLIFLLIIFFIDFETHFTLNSVHFAETYLQSDFIKIEAASLSVKSNYLPGDNLL